MQCILSLTRTFLSKYLHVTETADITALLLLFYSKCSWSVSWKTMFKVLHDNNAGEVGCHAKQTGMLVVSLRGVIFGSSVFRANANIFSLQGVA